MAHLSRRDLLAGAASLGLASVLRPAEASMAKPGKFRFVHFTDLHIQPELGAAGGVQAAVRKLLSLRARPDFVLTGGDHVMDVLATSRERANLQFQLLAEALKPLEMPVYGTVGNHDVYGWSTASSVSESDPEYGKKMFAERFTKRPLYHSFDHKGWHFVVLDSIQPEGKNWRSAIDDAQLTWLQNDLAKSKGTPTVLLTHVPVLTIFPQFADGTTSRPSDKIIVANGKEVQQLVQAHSNVRAVLQGHTHVVENCEYLGTRYLTGGAVCGEWWKGPRLGVHPEGFAVIDVDGDKFSWKYESYGWRARA